MARKSKDLAIELLSHSMLSSGLFSEGAVKLVQDCKVTKDEIDSALRTAWSDLLPDPHPVKDRYVIGFIFDEERKHVLLVWKNRPAWQNGKLNAPGGKVEENESALLAVQREIAEETGIKTDFHHWRYVGRRFRAAMSPKQDFSYSLQMFVTEVPLVDMKAAQEWQTDEEVVALPLNMEIIKRRGVPSLVWATDAALAALDTGLIIEVEDPAIFPEDDQ